MLTNDLHQLVFIFPANAAAWLDTDHGYGAGYFAVMGYIALGMVTAIVTMLLKCRIPHTKITLELPFVRFISVGSPWIELLAGDMTVVQCLLLAAGIESCIRCGLIQSNTGDILKAENAQKARKLKLEEQTKLYDLVEQESAPHFARLEALLSALSNAQSQEEAKPLLGRIAVIMTYIKRRSNLVFLAAQKNFIDANELLLCLNESAQALQLCKVLCTVRLKLGENISAVQAIALYDLFGAVLDTGRSLTAMLLFAEQSGGVLRARVSASCTESLDVLCSRFDGLTAEHDEDGLWHLTWTLPEVTA